MIKQTIKLFLIRIIFKIYYSLFAMYKRNKKLDVYIVTVNRIFKCDYFFVNRIGFQFRYYCVNESKKTRFFFFESC